MLTSADSSFEPMCEPSIATIKVKKYASVWGQ